MLDWVVSTGKKLVRYLWLLRYDGFLTCNMDINMYDSGWEEMGIGIVEWNGIWGFSQYVLQPYQILCLWVRNVNGGWEVPGFLVNKRGHFTKFKINCFNFCNRGENLTEWKWSWLTLRLRLTACYERRFVASCTAQRLSHAAHDPLDLCCIAMVLAFHLWKVMIIVSFHQKLRVFSTCFQLVITSKSSLHQSNYLPAQLN